MDKEEHKGILESLYPIGKERWIKVKFTDLKWCIKNLRLGRKNNNLGFEITALSVMEEHQPQVNAILEFKKKMNEMIDLEIGVIKEAAIKQF
jgi:hypothetical protein